MKTLIETLHCQRLATNPWRLPVLSLLQPPLLAVRFCPAEGDIGPDKCFAASVGTEVYGDFFLRLSGKEKSDFTACAAGGGVHETQ